MIKSNRVKPSSSKYYKKIAKPRIAFILLLFSIISVLIVLKLFYLQIFDASDRYAAQIDQSVTQVKTSASRGNILDRNGNILAQESSAKAIYIVPMNVNKGDEKKVAKAISSKLNIKYEKVIKIINKLEDDNVEVDSGVSSEKASALMAQVPEGIYFDSGKIYCCPAEIKDVSKATAAIVQILEMDQEDAKYYLTKRENSPQKIQTKVDNAVAEELLKAVGIYDEKTGELQDSNGLTLLEDHKRYYTKDTFLADVLGFMNDEYHGVNGIEATCDDVLSGENGIVLFQQDAIGNNIPSQTKVIREATAGEDVALTIDMNIQSQVEEILAATVDKWSAKSGTAIVMSCETAEILAMAEYPTYSLNDPYSIPDGYASHYDSAFAKMDEDEKQQEMWKNSAVSLTYEPGSTFKAVTSAAALEEGVVNPDTTVYCNGSMQVDDLIINCTGYHGTQSVRHAIANSCNPGLVQIIQRLSPFKFYNYAYNFGYGDSTGIELTGEEDGIFPRVIDTDGNCNLFEYSTMSFGQGLASTPIQNLTALNAVVNDGYYVKPTILKKENSENLHRNSDGKSVNQVISSSTSSEMRTIMSDVVSAETNYNLAKLVEGYPIGGKTGTAEQYRNGSYSEYITSFFCYAPIEDPKYTILVLLDGTDGQVTGSVSAAPAAIAMMKYILDGSAQGTGGVDLNTTRMPELIGQNIDTAKKMLEEKGIAYHITQQDSGSTVLSQSLETNSVVMAGVTVELVVGTSEQDASGTVIVPDLTGLSIQACNTMLNGLGLNLKVSGSGFAAGQDPPAGTKVEKETVVTVKFKNE